MVIKGGARSGAAALATHLQRVDTNERAELRELRGVAAKDLDGALLEMEAVSLGSRSRRNFYHASINTRIDDGMTADQWAKAIDRLEHELNLIDQPRAVVFHIKEGRAHVHVVWSRIDLSSMTAISDSHNYRRHEIVARELEREFGHARVQGAHIEREGQTRPERTPYRAEIQQGERTGPSPKQATEQLTGIWNRTDSGKAFAAAIAAEGWILARGDRRDFVVLDPSGEVHGLGRRIKGAKAKDVRTRMADVDVANLPTVNEAKALYRAREEASLTEARAFEGSKREKVDATLTTKDKSWLNPQQAERLRKQRRSAATTTTNATMVAQQSEAQRRFEKNSEDMEIKRQARIAALDKAITQQAERDQSNLQHHSKPKRGFER